MKKFNPDKINYFEEYNFIINNLKNAIKDSSSNSSNVIILFENFIRELNSSTSYMLFDRFLQSKPKKMKTKRRKQLDTDLILLFEIGKPNKNKTKEELELLDIVKSYKTMETFLLKRELILDIEELKLGKFKETIINAVNNLKTLLLSISQMDDLYAKEKLLNLTFSSISIYRSFSVKTKPDLSTITAEYNGEDLQKILDDEFNDSNIKE